MRKTYWTWLVVLIGGCRLVTIAAAQEPGDAELRMYLDGMRERLEDTSRPIAERQRLALEAAATLDRVAQGAASAEAQRRRWAEAAALLDRFLAAQPDRARSPELALQAAVYRWARAWTARAQAEDEPAREGLRRAALAELDAVIGELRALLPAPSAPATDLDANIRYRLARALADRAGLAAGQPGGGDTRPALEEALRLLRGDINDPAFRAQVALLRADLDDRLGRFAEALASAEDAERSDRSLPRSELLRVRAVALAGLDRGDKALRLIDAAGLDPATRTELAVLALLTRWERLAPGPDRRAVRAEITRRIAATPDPVPRRALREIARRLPPPEADADPAESEQLAEGQIELGHLGQAADLLAAAARRAKALGRHDGAAGLSYREAVVRLRAGATGPALDVLARLRDDARAGEVRARAGLLRALTLGRSGATAAYAAALEAQIHDFPEDTSSDEARWRLGHLRVRQGAADEAIRLWEAIPDRSLPGHAARLAVVRLRLDGLETRDPELSRAADSDITALVNYLGEVGKRQADSVAKSDLDLVRLRLELSPLVRRLDAAEALCGQLRSEPLRAEQRSRLEGYALVLAARRDRYRDAERAARTWKQGAASATILDIARLLDRSATWDDQDDLARRRYGSIAGELLEACFRPGAALAPAERTEARLLAIDAQYLTGDAVRACRELDRAALEPDALDLPTLGLLAQLQRRLGAGQAALRTEEARARRVPEGSKTWFDARFALALTYLQSGQLKAARQVLDATEVLHPDVGGPEGRERLEQLRERIRRRS